MTRSDRSTGRFRKRRGSGCVGILPASKPGSGPDTRRRTKPLRRGGTISNPAYYDSFYRGQQKQIALIERAYKRRISINRITSAIRKALSS